MAPFGARAIALLWKPIELMATHDFQRTWANLCAGGSSTLSNRMHKVAPVSVVYPTSRKNGCGKPVDIFIEALTAISRRPTLALFGGRTKVPCAAMRAVEIIFETGNFRPWVAIDRDTGQPLLRLTDRDQLERLCRRLGWHVARSQTAA
jgi:hypothetical protein